MRKTDRQTDKKMSLIDELLIGGWDEQNKNKYIDDDDGEKKDEQFFVCLFVFQLNHKTKQNKFYK